jgi:hypothetical protein
VIFPEGVSIGRPLFFELTGAEPIRDAGYRMQDAGYRIQDAGYRMQDAGCRIQVKTRY